MLLRNTRNRLGREARRAAGTVVQRFFLPAVVFLWIISPPGAYSQSSREDGDEAIRRSLAKITQAYRLLEKHLADSLQPEQALYEGAIRGALSSLDPFSVFLDASQFQMLQQQQRGVQQGFGAILNVQAGRVMVLHSLPGSPFGRAGLGPGDRIVEINDHRVDRMDLRELVEVLQAAKSKRVELSVVQGGKLVPRDFSLDPAEVPSPTVDKKFLLEPSLGYVHVARVEESTPGELRSILEEWGSNNLRGLILDLRDNPGGSLESAVATAGLFLRKGQAVVSLRGRVIPETKYVTESAPFRPELPLVVIMNGRSASAAEIIAAALQEHDRAWVVGEVSFGKGVVESVLPLSEGTALVLTTARYFTSSSRSIQRPLPGTALADILQQEQTEEFYTDNGRPLPSKGGVHPDTPAGSWQLDPWAEFLEESTAFMNFAQAYRDSIIHVSEDFEVDEAALGDFKNFLHNAGVRVPPLSWERSLPFVKVRIKTELFNLAYGIPRGNEVDVRGDPQVQSAIGALGQAQQLLRTADAARGSNHAPGRVRAEAGFHTSPVP